MTETLISNGRDKHFLNKFFGPGILRAAAEWVCVTLRASENLYRICILFFSKIKGLKILFIAQGEWSERGRGARASEMAEAAGREADEALLPASADMAAIFTKR